MTRQLVAALGVVAALCGSASRAGAVEGYLGCFTDTESRALPTWLGQDMSVQQCIDVARDQGYLYAGLQWYGHCFAGNQIGYEPAPEWECYTPCNADPGQMCGGPGRNSIYSTQYVGCFADGEDRALPQWLGQDMTVQQCLDAARDQGYVYAGLQWYGHCFAGDQLAYQQVPDYECSTPCSTAPAQTCGGPWRNSVYQVHQPFQCSVDAPGLAGFHVMPLPTCLYMCNPDLHFETCLPWPQPSTTEVNEQCIGACGPGCYDGTCTTTNTNPGDWHPSGTDQQCRQVVDTVDCYSTDCCMDHDLCGRMISHYGVFANPFCHAYGVLYGCAACVPPIAGPGCSGPGYTRTFHPTHEDCRPFDPSCQVAGTCGAAVDTCGNQRYLGDCPQGLECQGNVCRVTCAAQGAGCGFIADGAGGSLACGTCSQGWACNWVNQCEAVVPCGDHDGDCLDDCTQEDYSGDPDGDCYDNCTGEFICGDCSQETHWWWDAFVHCGCNPGCTACNSQPAICSSPEYFDDWYQYCYWCPGYCWGW